jgi:RimJ/RimL family protein N-acetyltransferase
MSDRPASTALAALAVRLTLRPPREGEQGVGEESVWEDWGERDAPRLADLGRFVVELDGNRVGSMSWHPVYYGPNLGSRAYNIGISLGEAHRGQGIGAAAQRMLVDHLFATTAATRVEASTDVDNIAEQRALERAGFTREGVLRQAQARADGLHDLVVYSVLRSERAAPAG